MSIFKIFFAVIIIVCLSVPIQSGNTKMTLQLSIVSMQSTLPDRGYIARQDKNEDELISMGTKELKTYLPSLEKEFDCGFLFSALVHLYLSNNYLSKPKILDYLESSKIKDVTSQLTQEEVNSITYTEEAKYMVHYAYRLKKTSLMEVMWIFYWLTLRSYDTIESYMIEDAVHDNEIILNAHVAVGKLLEDFTDSYGCKVYNQETCEVEEVRYVEKIKEVMEGRSTGNPLTLASNKERFLNQRRRNILPDAGIKNFEKDKLRFNRIMNDKDTIEELIKTFSVNADTKIIVDNILKRYKATYNVKVTLHAYINSFITLQSEFVIILQAMAMRIVIVYMNYMIPYLSIRSELSQNDPDRIRTLKEYNVKITNFVTEFFSLIGKRRKNSFKQLYCEKILYLLNTMVACVSRTLAINLSIKKMQGMIVKLVSSNENLTTLSKPVEKTDYDENWLYDVKTIANKYGITYSNDMKLPVENIFIVTDLYLYYIKEKINDVHFGVINSSIRLKKSYHYKRLVTLEHSAK